MCLAAYRLQAPLKWCTLSSASQPTKGSSVHSAPSKRFGSMLVNNGKALYVFGGATHMRTTFNDLWVFDLAFLQWKRVLGDECLFVPLDGALYHEFDLGTIGFSICWRVSHKSSSFGLHVVHPKSMPLRFPRKVNCPSSDTSLTLTLPAVASSIKRNQRCSLAILKSNAQENMELIRLFVQNSASEQQAGTTERIEANDLSESFPIREPSANNPNDVRVTFTSSLVSADSESVAAASQKMPNSRVSILTTEKGRSDRQSLVSMCGIDVPSEELENLIDVPLEFAMAELFLRRAVRSASLENKGDPVVARMESRKSETVPEACEENRSSVVPRTTDKLRTEQRVSLDSTTASRIHKDETWPFCKLSGSTVYRRVRK
ncbi:kelch repeat protein, partial [Opisthorchis viverrini]